MQLGWLVCLGLLVSVLSTSAAGLEQANCTLELQGYGPAQQGVKYMQLHCETSDGGDVLIGVDAEVIGKTDFRGVAVPTEAPECQRWFNSPDTGLPVYALLYFCDPNYGVTVVSPTVSNVHWDGEYGKHNHIVMLMDSVQMTVSGGVFRGNSVIAGAIIKAGRSVVAILESQFRNNTGGYGAIIVTDTQAEVRLSKTTIADNKALGDSTGSVNSVVSLTDSILNMDNCTFYHNSADGDAGAVETTRSNVSISNSVFAHNRAVRYGAVSFVDRSDVTIRNTTFAMNTAKYGGALGSTDSDIMILNSRLSSNSVGGDGGACYFTDSVVHIRDSVFSNNRAPNSAQGFGGALLVGGSQITMSGSNFTGNQADSGGVLNIDWDTSLNATNCIFRNNMCPPPSGTGGVLYGEGNAFFSNCIVENNHAATGGVVSAWLSANITISDGSRIAQNSAEYIGGAFRLAQHASLTVLAGKIVNNTAGSMGGAIYTEQDTVVKLVDSQLLGNSAAPDAGGYGGAIYAKDNSTVALVGSRIAGNSADTGGGVHSYGDVALTANASIISHNTAIIAAGVYGEGGTVAFLNHSRVEYNVAVGYGGGAAWVDTEFDVEQVKAAVRNNTAKYDDDIFVPAASISFAHRSPNRRGMVSSLQDGAVLYVFDVKGVHELPSRYSSVKLVLVSLSDESQTFTLGPFKPGDSNGVETIVDVPPDRYNVSVTVDTNTALSLNFTINFPFCGIGMVRGVDGHCSACPGGSYSLSREGNKCLPCPDGAQCLGGAMVTPEPSYWRSTPLSDQVHRCPNPVACQPANAELVVSCANNTVERAANTTAKLHATDAVCNGTNYKTLQCTSGYQGNLCGVCAVGYGSTNVFTCRQCMGRGFLLAMYVLAAVVLLGAIKVLCHFTLSETSLASVTATTAQPLRQTGSRPRVTDLLKPLVLYFQYFLVVATANLDWPQSISYPVKALAWVFSSTSPETLSVDCLFSAGGLPVAIKKTLFYLIAPLFMLGMLLLLEAIGHVWRRRSNADSNRIAAASVGDLLVSSSIVILFFFLPSLARTTLSMFACIRIDVLGASSTDIGLRAVGRYWLLDVNQQCFKGYHARWSFGLGVPLVLLVCCTLPGAIFYLAFKSRKQLAKSASFDRHYAFLFRTYKPSCNFWEGVIAMQTVAFVTVSVFGHALGPYYQILLIVFVLNCVYIMLLVSKPYAQAEAQRVMEYGVLCLLLTAFTSLTFLPDGYMQGGNTSSTYKLVMGVLLVLLNAIFVAYVAWRLFALVPWVKIYATLKATATKSLLVVKSQVSGIGGVGSFSGLASKRVNTPDGSQQSPADLEEQKDVNAC